MQPRFKTRAFLQHFQNGSLRYICAMEERCLALRWSERPHTTHMQKRTMRMSRRRGFHLAIIVMSGAKPPPTASGISSPSRTMMMMRRRSRRIDLQNMSKRCTLGCVNSQPRGEEAGSRNLGPNVLTITVDVSRKEETDDTGQLPPRLRASAAKAHFGKTHCISRIAGAPSTE